MSTVRRTLSEIAAMAQKAARGAGCPWGLAEEAGQGVRVLESHGLPGVATLATLLNGQRSCACTGTTGAPACGIIEAARLSDRLEDVASTGLATTDPVAGALLLAAPVLAGGSTLDRPVTVSIGDHDISNGPDGPVGMPCFEMMQNPLPVTIRAGATPGGVCLQPSPRSRLVAASDWTALEALAARTLVPETEASRARGAGPSDDKGA